MPAQEMSNIQEYTTKHIIYDEDYFASYHVTGVLSNTSNGIIYRAERLSDGKNVVIKQVAKKTIKYFYQIHGQPCPAEFVYHFTASAGIGTDFVVKPIEWLEGDDSYILVMEHETQMMDLFEATQKMGYFNESDAKSILKQVYQGTTHCLSVGILHRDIKDENVLVNIQTREVRLIDFGCAAETLGDDSDEYVKFCGTAEYYPPEYYNSHKYYSKSLCVWQLGCLLYILLTGAIPFEKENIPKCIRTRKYERHLSAKALDAIDEMLNPDESERIKLEHVLDLPFFN